MQITVCLLHIYILYIFLFLKLLRFKINNNNLHIDPSQYKIWYNIYITCRVNSHLIEVFSSAFEIFFKIIIGNKSRNMVPYHQ